jgi:hypothetical protein
MNYNIQATTLFLMPMRHNQGIVEQAEMSDHFRRISTPAPKFAPTATMEYIMTGIDIPTEAHACMTPTYQKTESKLRAT